MNSLGTYCEIDDNLCPLFIGENPLMSKVLCKVQCVLVVQVVVCPRCLLLNPSKVSSVFLECMEGRNGMSSGVWLANKRFALMCYNWKGRGWTANNKKKKREKEEEVLEVGP